MSDTYNQSAFDLLVWLRGGLPVACDFCGQPYSEARHPVPEEAGEWACSECAARWYPTNPQEADDDLDDGIPVISKHGDRETI